MRRESRLRIMEEVEEEVLKVEEEVGAMVVGRKWW